MFDNSTKEALIQAMSERPHMMVYYPPTEKEYSINTAWGVERPSLFEAVHLTKDGRVMRRWHLMNTAVPHYILPKNYRRFERTMRGTRSGYRLNNVGVRTTKSRNETSTH